MAFDKTAQLNLRFQRMGSILLPNYHVVEPTAAYYAQNAQFYTELIFYTKYPLHLRNFKMFIL